MNSQRFIGIKIIRNKLLHNKITKDKQLNDSLNNPPNKSLNNPPNKLEYKCCGNGCYNCLN